MDQFRDNRGDVKESQPNIPEQKGRQTRRESSCTRGAEFHRLEVTVRGPKDLDHQKKEKRQKGQDSAKKAANSLRHKYWEGNPDSAGLS